MAVTYNVAKCRRGWGVYVRAISGDDLKILTPSTNLSVARVTSGRLARKRSKLSAKNFIKRISAESRGDQIARLKNSWIKIAPSHYQVIPISNLRFYRQLPASGEFVHTFSTTSRAYAENASLFYAERNIETFFKVGVTRHIKLPLK